MGGVAGVGALLKLTFVAPSPTNCFVASDGNGNVSALLNAADATLLGQYEYGPFGEAVRATGSTATVNPFRFSIKYKDDETDHLYYGYRYYNATPGRWLSRDPLAERSDLNLYDFVRNDALNHSDRIGLLCIPDPLRTTYGTPYYYAASSGLLLSSDYYECQIRKNRPLVKWECCLTGWRFPITVGAFGQPTGVQSACHCNWVSTQTNDTSILVLTDGGHYESGEGKAATVCSGWWAKNMPSGTPAYP